MKPPPKPSFMGDSSPPLDISWGAENVTPSLDTAAKAWYEIFEGSFRRSNQLTPTSPQPREQALLSVASHGKNWSCGLRVVTATGAPQVTPLSEWRTCTCIRLPVQL